VHDTYVANEQVLIVYVNSPWSLVVLRIVFEHAVLNHFISHLCHQLLANCDCAQTVRSWIIFRWIIKGVLYYKLCWWTKSTSSHTFVK